MLLHLGKDLAHIPLRAAGNVRTEAHGFFIGSLFDDLIQPVKSAAADKQDIGGVHLDKLLVGVLAPALGRHIGHGTFQQLQQRLLHALAGYVPGDGCILALAGDLVDLIDVNNPLLGPLHIEVRRLQQLQDHILHILAYITGLGQGGGVGNGEGHIQHLCHGLGKQSLAAAGGTDQQDVAFLQLHILLCGVENPLVVVIYSHRQNLFCLVLPNDIVVQSFLDLHGLGQLGKFQRQPVITHDCRDSLLFSHDACAHAHTFVADIAVVAGDHSLHQRLGLAAKRASYASSVFISCHMLSPLKNMGEL